MRSGSLSVNDPTGHSDTSCIRKACKKLKTTNVEGCTLYSSLEPCLMCFSAANWANIDRIVYGCKKSDELIGKFCYEGKTDIEIINQVNNHKIELECISDFENESLEMIAKWVSDYVK